MSPSRKPDPLFEEIFQQMQVWEDLVCQWPDIQASLQFPPEGIQCLVGIAEGSSRHTLEMAQPYIEAWTDLPLRVYKPDAIERELRVMATTMDPRNLFHDSYFIVVSQSGETASVLDILKSLGTALGTEDGKIPFPVLVITNQQTSSLQKLYGNHLYLSAGAEEYIAATKTLTTSFLALLLWGLSFGERLGRVPPEKVAQVHQRLNHLPECLGKLLHHKRPLNRVLDFTKTLTEVNHFILLSKGMLVSLLPEAGLKLVETSSNIVYTDNTESFKHGPKVMLSGVQGVTPNTIYLVPGEEELAAELFTDLRAHFGLPVGLKTGQKTPPQFPTHHVFFMTFQNGPRVPLDLQEQLRLPQNHILTLPEGESALERVFLGLVTFQLISFYLAWLRGESPDNPALSKAVTD